MKNNAELEHDDIEITKLDYLPLNILCANIETWFDVDIKFKTNTREKLEWVDVFCLYFYPTEEIKVIYFISNDTIVGEANEYLPNENEKKVLLDKLTTFCQDKHKCSLAELINKERRNYYKASCQCN